MPATAPGMCAPPTMTYCYSTTYTYAGAKQDLKGRGFLGSTAVASTDVQTSIVTTSNYRTDFPYIGMIASQTQVRSGTTLSSSVNTWAATGLGGTRNLRHAQPERRVRRRS